MGNLTKNYSVELKPCPFCGDNFPKVKTKYLKKKDMYRCSVVCENCGGRVVYVEDETEEGLRLAVKVWNEREELR